MRLFVAFIVVCLSFAGTLAHAFEGFVPLKTGREVYVKTQNGDKNQPTLLLINGLTYSLDAWDDFSRALAQYKLNVIRFDMTGQGKVLVKNGPVRDIIRYEDQVADLEALLEVLNLDQVTTVGLSYGAAIAVAHATKFPMRVERVVAMAPYTEALRTQDEMIQQQILTTRLMFPFNPASDDELYDFFLRQIIYSTYPSAEPSILNHPYKLDATFRMVQGIRKLKLSQLIEGLTKPVHLMQAEFDQYLDDKALEDFWLAVPSAVKQSRSIIGSSEHKIPEAQPTAAAAWLHKILLNHPLIVNGNMFFVDPQTMQAVGDAGTIELSKK